MQRWFITIRLQMINNNFMKEIEEEEINGL